MSGPLSGLRLLEFEAIGPVPMCATLLADLGAEIIFIDRPRPRHIPLAAADETMRRGRRSIAVDLKHPRGLETVLRLIENVDAILEGFRPGVLERLGLGPHVCLARNPRLVYCRMTGYGQDGPLAASAGHDIDYIALAGVLHGIGRPGERPVPPLNLVGDYGGGALFLALGLLAALFERTRSGKGQVVDAAMIDGAASLAGVFYALRSKGAWSDERGNNLLDGGAPFYDTYETADGKYVAVGALEPQFFAELARRIGLEERFVALQPYRAAWPELRARLTDIFRSRSRAEWCTLLEGSDACVAPVLSLAEAPGHAHQRARNAFIERDGVVQPAPAPRFSRTPGATAPALETSTDAAAAALNDCGFTHAEIAELYEVGALSRKPSAAAAG